MISASAIGRFQLIAHAGDVGAGEVLDDAEAGNPPTTAPSGEVRPPSTAV